ncbi:hypothetical protein [Paracoccus onubensis]|uniref:Uncharacterized protein n=1 Tax=Paracoccus onubensis TaxID=1675788 RepID=A0A418T442_9RHOB|nr:hypothetical protein [Paracoccus onubensis]RJE87982.1 hypothetical protein D3P04_03410 [Paracoccus onubensis]
MSFLSDDALADQDADTLIRTVLSQAAELAGQDTFNPTGRAAIYLLATTIGVPRTIVGGTPADPAPLADLIGGVREIIRQDPDGSSKWVEALQTLLRTHRAMTDPTQWRPTKAQMEMGRQALGLDEGDIVDFRFTEAGNLIAKRGLRNWVEINPQDGSTVRTPRQDVV